MNIKTLTTTNKSILSLLFIHLKHVSGVYTHLKKTRLLPTEDNYNEKCPECSTVVTLSNFPILFMNRLPLITPTSAE